MVDSSTNIVSDRFQGGLRAGSRTGLGGPLGPSNILGAVRPWGPQRDTTHPRLEFLFRGGKDPARTPLFGPHFGAHQAPKSCSSVFEDACPGPTEILKIPHVLRHFCALGRVPRRVDRAFTIRFVQWIFPASLFLAFFVLLNRARTRISIPGWAGPRSDTTFWPPSWGPPGRQNLFRGVKDPARTPLFGSSLGPNGAKIVFKCF